MMHYYFRNLHRRFYSNKIL